MTSYASASISKLVFNLTASKEFYISIHKMPLALPLLFSNGWCRLVRKSGMLRLMLDTIPIAFYLLKYVFMWLLSDNCIIWKM